MLEEAEASRGDGAAAQPAAKKRKGGGATENGAPAAVDNVVEQASEQLLAGHRQCVAAVAWPGDNVLVSGSWDHSVSFGGLDSSFVLKLRNWYAGGVAGRRPSAAPGTNRRARLEFTTPKNMRLEDVAALACRATMRSSAAPGTNRVGSRFTSLGFRVSISTTAFMSKVHFSIAFINRLTTLPQDQFDLSWRVEG